MTVISKQSILKSALPLAFMAFCLSVSGCSTLQRSSASGYESKNERALSPEGSRDHGDEASALRRAEKALEGRREREQYFKNKPYMRSNRDRLEFLSIESYEGRARWLTAHGVQGAATPHNPDIQALVDINDITVGMTKQAVRDSWGEPELVEVAGNPLYGNERWAYSEQLPTTDGFQTEKRTIFFEAGRVVGWERK